MRVFAVAADIAMGIVVGIFLFALLTRLWPSTSHPAVAALVIAAAMLMVFMRPRHHAPTDPR